jgi:hypothetical protein
MKLKLLLLILVNIFFIVSTQAQSEAVKIDDYTETTTENLKLLAEKTKSFAERLRKEQPTSRAFIIYYLETFTVACKDKSKTKVEERIEFVKDQLINKYKISPDRVVVSADSFRNDTRVEFWIVPKDVREPTGEGGFFLDCDCPVVAVSEISEDDGIVFSRNETVIFKAYISGLDLNSVKFKWNVSAGEIIDGQGTSVIKVDLTKVSAEEVKASVKIDYDVCCDSYCMKEDSTTIKIRKD